MDNILFVLAAISFGLAAFKVPEPVVAWIPTGYCLITLALWVL